MIYNYMTLHDDDRRTVKLVRDFFVEAFAADGKRTGRHGIDVGTGANLYPALAMLPFCDTLTLYEHSRANISWLTTQRATNWPSWDEVWSDFWLILCQHDSYAKLGSRPDIELARRADITSGNIFDLGNSPQRWDIGTMFFVAESITSDDAEFTSAVNNFLDVLKPGAPFAMAFMEHSSGYQVAGRRFPAIAVDQHDVARCLQGRTTCLLIERTGRAGPNSIRPGYTGILVACGRVKSVSSPDAGGHPPSSGATTRI